MDDEARNKELEKRERLVQTFLTIGSFFVAFAKGEIQQILAAIFASYLVFTILYYVFISRIKEYQFIIDLFAFVSSLFFSLLIVVFFPLQAPSLYSEKGFWFSWIVLTGILTFSLLSPETSNRIIEFLIKLINVIQKISKSYPRVTKVVVLILTVILIIGIFQLLSQVLSRIKFV